MTALKGQDGLHHEKPHAMRLPRKGREQGPGTIHALGNDPNRLTKHDLHRFSEEVLLENLELASGPTLSDSGDEGRGQLGHEPCKAESQNPLSEVSPELVNIMSTNQSQKVINLSTRLARPG